MSGCCSNSGGCGSKSSTLPSDKTVKFDAADGSPITVTPAAVDAMKNAIKQEGESGDGIRISVVGGGCSGYQYGLDFEKEPRMDDVTLSYDGLSVYVDPISAGFLKGTTVDFVSGLNGTGFKFNNPNAKRTCGCGSSFS